ncbi:hypothetical protein LCGC14_0529380 [marine sediment metagenome]|uniref:Polymerase nucleotidyl transferase domain-containing protein n=1 Tax=marine sediment metagenome TaxID=412755 RepID=A0A0F9S0X6_9ZZZZ
MTTELEQVRQSAVADFGKRQPRLLAMLREDFGDVVTDLRLLGSVLDPKRFHSGSDVDAAVVVNGPCAKLNRALYVEGYFLLIKTSQGILALDPITMDEAQWRRWSRGRRS